MIEYSLLGISILIQLVAAGLTLRLVKLTGTTLTWLLIASAFILMALRRGVVLFQLVATDAAHSVNIPAEILALLISILMLVGVILIKPFVVALRKSRSELRQSEAIYRSILENMIDTYYRTDKNGLITMCSASASELLGYEMDELIGKPLRDLYVHPTRREDILTVLKERRYVREYHSLLKRKDGSNVLVEVSANLLIDEDGQISGIEEMVRDITKRQQVELINTRMGRIVEDSVNEIYIFDSQSLNFILVNFGARTNLGYSMQELLHLTPADIKPDVTREQFSDLIQPLRDGTATIIKFNTTHQRKDGTTYPVEVGIQLSLSETPPVFFAIIQDISERTRTESALRQAQKMEAVGQLTGGLAHDFNNLLTVVMGNIELARAEPELTENLDDYLKSSFDAAKRGATLTQRLLAFSRKQILQPVVLDLRKLVSRTEELLRRTLRENIEIEVIGNGRLWKCEVDPGQLENALLNLSINASDAMPEGGKLTIETSNAFLDDRFAATHFEAAVGQYVLMAVSDTGTGMTKEILSQVFEPFFTTKNEGSGSGLGLSMVYGLVKQSGGSIDVYSEIDEGTTIKIYLPRVLDKALGEFNDVESSDDPRGHGETILVVEDDEDLRQLTVEMLRRSGYAVVEASDAHGALLALESTQGVDLMLTDVILPGTMNGAILAREVVRRWPEIRVLFMSGYTENAVIHQGRLDPGVQLLQKPFTKSQLSIKVRNVLEKDL